MLVCLFESPAITTICLNVAVNPFNYIMMPIGYIVWGQPNCIRHRHGCASIKKRFLRGALSFIVKPPNIKDVFSRNIKRVCPDSEINVIGKRFWS